MRSIKLLIYIVCARYCLQNVNSMCVHALVRCELNVYACIN